MTFQVGNYVVHSSQGVCLVKDRVFNSFASGSEKEYYVLAPLHDQRNTRYIPVEVANKSLRDIMSKDQMMNCIKNLPNVIGEINLSKNAKKMFIEQANRSMDTIDKIRLMKTMYLIKEECEKKGKSMSYADEMVLREVENFFFGEISIVMNIPMDEVLSFISTTIEN